MHVERSSKEILLQEEMQNTLNYFSIILSEVDNSLEKFLAKNHHYLQVGQFRSLNIRTIMETKKKKGEDYFLSILLEQCAPTNVCCDDEDESNYENDYDELHI